MGKADDLRAMREAQSSRKQPLRSKPIATQFPRKRGRPALGAKPMTAQERNKRWRARGDESKA